MGQSVETDEASTGERLLKLLANVWPNTADVDPAHLGLSGRTGGLAFLDTIEELSDGGLLGYEALMIDMYGPRIHQAAITPKGRALLRNDVASELQVMTLPVIPRMG